MLFYSFEFVLLLVISLIAFYLFPSKMRLYLLTLADIAFYIVTGLHHLFLFIIISMIVYFCAIEVRRSNKSIYTWLGILTAISSLAFFKYTGFILENITDLFSIEIFRESTFVSNIVLPLGISFYTFQMIAYLVDVSKNKIDPCRNILVFWVFISFFGHLIAGPILRGKDFLPQVEQIASYRFRLNEIKIGCYYIIMGLTKKIILADTLAPRVDYYFNQVNQLNSLDAWFAAYLFAFQLYFDFSAYSDMAVGIGRLFGLRMNINFKTPYISANASEFWKRWHITLSTWIRDYVYIPLGGSRGGLMLQCLFIIAAMAVSGLWHGASWTFVIWGIYHGLLSSGHKVLTVLNERWRLVLPDTFLSRAISIFIFFQLTTIGWVFFRAATINDAFQLIYKMLTFSHIEYNPVYLLYFSFIIVLYLMHMMEYFLVKHKETLMICWSKKIPSYLKAALYIVLLTVLILCIKTEHNSFIYFQF